MLPDIDGYESGSSLADLAGNYTLRFQPATNALNIAADGAIFGTYDNGPDCTVNGTANIIDPAYGLIEVSWTFSQCSDPLGLYEGVSMTGFAIKSLIPNADPGSYYFLLTGQNLRGLYSISVLFDPV